MQVSSGNKQRREHTMNTGTSTNMNTNTDTNNQPTFTGYDGRAYTIGDRVEIHPGTDLWMRGARFGKVVGASLTPKDRVHVTMAATGRELASSEDTFRKVNSPCSACKSLDTTPVQARLCGCLCHGAVGHVASAPATRIMTWCSACGHDAHGEQCNAVTIGERTSCGCQGAQS